MNERPTYVYIPPNVTGGGSFAGGLISIRNAIEGIIVVAFFALIKYIADFLIPFAVVGWIFLFIGIGIGLVCVMGINGEPASIFLLNVINFENRRVFVTLRPPMPEKKKKPRKESWLERKIKAKMEKES